MWMWIGCAGPPRWTRFHTTHRSWLKKNEFVSSNRLATMRNVRTFPSAGSVSWMTPLVGNSVGISAVPVISRISHICGCASSAEFGGTSATNTWSCSSGTVVPWCSRT